MRFPGPYTTEEKADIIFRQNIAEYNFILPGIVHAYDKEKGMVQVKIGYKWRNSLAVQDMRFDYFELPIMEFPLVLPHNKDFALTFTPKEGDAGIVLTMDRNLYNFYTSGQVVIPEDDSVLTDIPLHNLGSSVFIPGMFTMVDLVDLPEDRIQLISRNSKVKVDVGKDDVTIDFDENNYIKVSSAGVYIKATKIDLMSSTVNINGEYTANGHMHGGGTYKTSVEGESIEKDSGGPHN